MSVPENVPETLARAAKGWWLLLSLGVLMIVAGIFAIFTPFIAGIEFTIVIGVLFLLGAAVHLIRTLETGKGAGHIVVGLVVAALYGAAGCLLIFHPLRGLITLTFVLALLYTIGGAFRIALAVMTEGRPAWGVQLVGGLLSLGLGLLIYITLPTSILWALGIIVGVDLIFFGWTLVAESITVHTIGQAGMRLAGQH
jgi:uncharacterized membrane protein HdeD (DUF308 family)